MLLMRMKFSVQHTTLYQYSTPVVESFNDARLCPVSDSLQQCVNFELQISPQSTNVLRRLDFYTNEVHHFEVMEPHESLEVGALSEVETFIDSRDDSVSSPSSMLKGLERDERYYDFLAASSYIALSPMIEHEAKEIVDPLVDVSSQVKQVMAFVYENFEYAPGSTQVETTVMRVFGHKRGVCQDFAHMMIAFCRAVGIPARYVSGYFYIEQVVSGTADDNTAFDPTHNRRVGDIYIKLAHGRDYADTCPLAGSFRGDASVEMRVSVRIARID